MIQKVTLGILSGLIVTVLYSQKFEPQPEFFRKVRELPLVELKTTRQIRVSDHGAVPNDGKDDLGAILTALERAKSKAKENAAVEVIFEKGQYDLFSSKRLTHLIDLRDAQNLVISGNSAEIIIHNAEVGFMSVLNCKNVIVKDLFIDYDPLPFTQGRVVGMDSENNTFDLKIDEGFPSLNEEFFTNATQNWGMLKDKDIPGKLKDGVKSLYASKGWTELETGLFRIELRGEFIQDFALNDVFVQIARNNGMSLFKSGGSKNITYLNITSYSSPAGSYSAQKMEEWNIIGCKLLLKDGRFHSANADCIHVTGSAFGPWVENCLFEGYSDDAVNLKFTRHFILEKISPTELIVKYTIKPLEIVKFYNPREGVLIGMAMVLSSEDLGKNRFKIKLSQPINVERVGEDKRNDLMYVDTGSCESFVFRNNVFRNARRFGMLLQSSYGVIENNIFENLSQCAISMNNGVDWGEGFVAHDILIQKNQFKNCGYDATFLEESDAATIRMRVTKLKNPEAKGQWCGVATAPWQGLKNIWILDNEFTFNKTALSIECSEDVVIKGNSLVHNPNDLNVGTKPVELLKQNNTNLIFEK